MGVKCNSYSWVPRYVFLVYLCCAYLGNSFEVKIEAASNDINECPRDDKPGIGTLCFLYLRQCLRHCFHVIHLSCVHGVRHVNYLVTGQTKS